MTTSPWTGFIELEESETIPAPVVVEMGRRIEGGANLYPVEDKDENDPPGACADGAQYIVASVASGAWTGHENKIATAVGTNAANGWLIRTVSEGVFAYVRDENALYRHNGSAWGLFSSGAITVDNDTTLAGDSATNVPSQHAVKSYVDGKVAGLSWKQAVRVATTGAGTLASSFENGDTVDGVTLATGDRILIKNQAAGAENGIYTVNASGAPTRATDADAAAELVNASVYVSEGTANADTQWTCSTNAPITVNTTALTFAQLTSGGGDLLAANNLSDVASAATSRTNLGLGTAATRNIHVGTSAPGSPAVDDLWVDTN